jgi:hypothetical protein
MNIAYLTDRPELPQGEHNYQKAFRWLLEQRKLKLASGTDSDITFRHDSWCNVYDGHLCNCRPDVVHKGKRYKYPAKILSQP